MARTRMGLMIELDPERARRDLLAALRRNGWSTRATADDLGVDWATAKRWVDRLGLRDVVDREQRKGGLFARGGRRPKKKRRK